MPDSLIENLAEVGRWRTHKVAYYAGRWEQLQHLLPKFEAADFRVSPDSPANPYMKAVVRLPRNLIEQPIPVGTVSNAYTLAQHDAVAGRCIEGIRRAGVETHGLRCELGLTELGEWMNFRVCFPDAYSFTPGDGKTLKLRLDCFNSVDGSSRLVVLLAWVRLICSNGLVVRETKTEFRDVHNSRMDLDEIPGVICESLMLVKRDRARLIAWESHPIPADLCGWADSVVAKQWNKKAACRVFHICTSGHDVDIADPFAPGKATEKEVRRLDRVPGAAAAAANLYDVSQALSWVATHRNNTEERVEWQSDIPDLVEKLARNA